MVDHKNPNLAKQDLQTRAIRASQISAECRDGDAAARRIHARGLHKPLRQQRLVSLFVAGRPNRCSGRFGPPQPADKIAKEGAHRRRQKRELDIDLGAPRDWVSRSAVVCAQRLSSPPSQLTQVVSLPLCYRPLHGAEFMSGFPVLKSTGTETCSCTMSHLLPILRYTSVTRTVKSTGLSFVSVPVTCWMLWL